MLHGKKLLATAGAAAMIFGACSGSATPSPSAGGAASSPSGAAKAYNLTLIQGVKGDPFYVTMACGAQAEATKEGANLTVTGGDKWDATVQTPVVNSVTASKPDGVMVCLLYTSPSPREGLL